MTTSNMGLTAAPWKVTSNSTVPLDPAYQKASNDTWIAEWTGQEGRAKIEPIVKQALPLAHDNEARDLVVQYLQKSDIFGLAKLEAAAPGDRDLIGLIENYDQEKPLPSDIDDMMQAPLSRYFDEVTLTAFHRFREHHHLPRICKMTELYSLYWRPKGSSVEKAERLAKKHGAKICDFSFYGGSPGIVRMIRHGLTVDGRWIVFPNDVLGRNTELRDQKDRTPKGFEFPNASDAIFCIFMKYVYTGEKIFPSVPLTYTLCQEKALYCYDRYGKERDHSKTKFYDRDETGKWCCVAVVDQSKVEFPRLSVGGFSVEQRSIYAGGLSVDNTSGIPSTSYGVAYSKLL